MIDQKLAQSLKAWPFKEALQIIKKNGGFIKKISIRDLKSILNQIK